MLYHRPLPLKADFIQVIACSHTFPAAPWEKGEVGSQEESEENLYKALVSGMGKGEAEMASSPWCLFLTSSDS